MALATSPTGSVSGTGTAGTIPIWSNTVTIGNSLLTQSGSIVTLTGTMQAIVAATQDSIILAGRAGGVSSFSNTITTVALTASRIFTLPDGNVTIPSGTLLTGTLANANRLDSTSGAGVVKESQIADAVTGSVLTIAGTLTGLRTQTARDASGNLCLDSVNNAFTVAQTIGTDPGGSELLRVGGSTRFAPAATQDAVVLAGRAGGTSSFSSTITTATLSVSQIATLPNKTGTLAMLSDIVTSTGLGWNRTLQEFSGPAAQIGGYTWVSRTLPSSQVWSAVTYGNGVFVAVAGGPSTTAATSPDGITWTAQTLPSSQAWLRVTYGNGVFVTVAGGPSAVAATSPDGITWTTRTLPSSQTWSWVTYGNGVFVTVAGGPSAVAATSPDGITWTTRTLPSSQFWASVIYGNGVFVTVAGGPSAVAATSPDGITWTTRTLPTSSGWFSVAFGNGLFVALSGSTAAASSPDGITWTARTFSLAAGTSGITWGNGIFVSVTGGTASAATSGGALTFAGDFTASRTQTARDASGNLCLDSVNNAFTVAQTFGATINVPRNSASLIATGGTQAALRFGAGGTVQLDSDLDLALRVGGSTSLYNALSITALGLTYVSNQLIVGTDPGGSELLRVGGPGRFVGGTTVVQTTGAVSGRLTTADATSYSELILANTGTAGREYRVGVGGNTSGIATLQGSWYVYDVTAAAARLYVNSSGSLIIGTDPGGTELLRVGGALRVNSSTMIATSTSFTNGSGVSAGTIANAPSVGNPTKWIPINDNGTIRYVPAW